MKKGYSVENGTIFENDNCILVDNDKLNFLYYGVKPIN